MVVSYTLPIVTIALSLTIRPQFAIEMNVCDAQFNQSGSLCGSKFRVFPLE